MDLKDKVAIVTGGARDIGRSVSVKLAALGAKVCVNYFEHPEEAEETLNIIKKAGGVAVCFKGDMTKTAEVKALVDFARKKLGDDIHVLVNVAGGMVGRKKLVEQDDEWYDKVMDVNFRTCYLAIRETIPYMVAGGAIVNFSSLAARDGGGGGASLYATAKGAVSTFTRSVAKELGPQGIRCNAVCPGTIATSFHDRFNTPENRDRLKGSYALRREGTADEVADLVCYLASDDSSYITGANIDINGGSFFS